MGLFNAKELSGSTVIRITAIRHIECVAKLARRPYKDS